MESIFPQEEAYQRLVEVEVEEIEDETSMRVLLEASAETDTRLRAAALQRLEKLGSSNIVDKVTVSDAARVKVGNEYISQTIWSNGVGLAVVNKVGELEGRGTSKTHIGDSFGGTQFMNG